jgi:hypothetical protein
MQETIIRELEEAYERSREAKGEHMILSSQMTQDLELGLEETSGGDGEDLLVANPNRQILDDSDEDTD